MGTDNIITLFFLIVAALIFLNLRSVLGKRTGTEKPPFDPYSRDNRQMDSQAQGADDGKVITLPRREQQAQPQSANEPFPGYRKYYWDLQSQAPVVNAFPQSLRVDHAIQCPLDSGE